MRIKEFIELSNQELLAYLKDKLKPFYKPTAGGKAVYDALEIERSSLWNRHYNSSLIKKTLRHGISDYSITNVILDSKTGLLSCKLGLYRNRDSRGPNTLGYVRIKEDKICIYDIHNNRYRSIHDLVYSNRWFPNLIPAPHAC